MNIILISIVTGLFFLGSCKSPGEYGESDKSPNILWLIAEDIGTEIGCYGDKNATTPVIDQLAKKGVIFTNAFATSPICAPSRSSIITGMYSPSIGSQHNRCIGKFPEDYKYFPQFLRDNGYFSTNNSLTDYNLKFNVDNIWNESGNNAHWRNRVSFNQPFFSVFSYSGTHEISLNDVKRYARIVKNVPEILLKKPGDIQLPPYLPNTLKVNEIWSRYYNNITAFDFWVKEILDQLNKDGLTDNTIVFIFSDNGAGIPRHKRWLYDGGIKVPLIVYAPRKYQNLVPGRSGSKNNDLISLIDLAPTVLNLARINIPANMQGRAFLGRNLSPERNYIFASRDRMDERNDMQRAVRDKQFKYIRYFEPAKPFTQYMNNPENGEIMKAIREAFKNGTLPEAGQRIMSTVKPPEELFDLEKDPFELKNLATNPKYKQKLTELREAQMDWYSKIYDSGLIPETILRAWEQHYSKSIFRILRDENIPMNDIYKVALSSDFKTLVDGLTHENEAVRFWGATNLGNQPVNQDKDTGVPQLTILLSDPVPVVRLASARAICKLSNPEPGLKVLIQELNNENEWVRLYAIQVLDELGNTSLPFLENIREMMKDRNFYVVRVANHAINQMTGTNNVIPGFLFNNMKLY